MPWSASPHPSSDSRRSRSAIFRSTVPTIAQTHLRSILAYCNSPLMNSIEAYIQFERGLITDDGEVTNTSTADFLRAFMVELSGFIARVYTALPRPT